MSDTQGMIVLAIVCPEEMPALSKMTKLEAVFMRRFGFLTDFEVKGNYEEVEGKMGFNGIVQFYVDYMPIHASDARGCSEEMAAYIEAFLHGAAIEFEVIDF